MGAARKPRPLDECGPSDLLTMADVERAANVSRHVVREAIRTGDLPSVRLGERVLRFKAKDVMRWLDMRTYGRITPLNTRKRA